MVGWSGADTLVDSSRARNSRFYDTDDGTVATGREVDDHPYVQPADTSAEELPERDWGSRRCGAPVFYASSDLGVLLGYNWARQGYGFRRQPYASSIGLSGAWAFARSSGRLTLDTKFKLTNRSTYVTADAIASGIESLQFYGIGNAALDVGPSKFFRVHRQELGFGLGLGWGLESRQKLRIGVRAEHSVTDLDDQPEPTAPIVTEAPYGVDDFGYAGVVASWEWDTRDKPQLPSRGVRFVVDGGAYPITWSNGDGAFGAVNLAAAGFWSPGDQTALTLVARGGGRVLFGDYPYFEAAYLGGVRSLRGFPANRFAGDASVFGSAEARLRVFKTFIVVPGELGVFGLADVGRVFIDDEANDPEAVEKWHSDFGGGLYYGFLSRTFVVAAGGRQARRETGSTSVLGWGSIRAM